MSHPFFAATGALAIGHRGCAGEVPENTLASFERGLADGAEVIETDAHLTRDGVPVLIHDSEVSRVSEARGDVRDLDWKTLSELDAGYRFCAPDGGTPFRGRGLRIPSLAETLAALPDARFNIELKETRSGMVERALAVVREAGAEARTLLTAADDALMQRLRAAVRDGGFGVALGASAAEVGRFALAAQQSSEPPPGVMALQVPPHFAGQTLVTPVFVAHAHAHGIAVHVWTINEPDEIDAWLALGVDGIVSDFPARVAQAVKRRA